MSFNPCPSFYSHLSCTPQSQCFNFSPGPTGYNPYSGCSLLPPPSFTPSCELSSGKFAKFANGNGDLCHADRQIVRPCCEPQPHKRECGPLKSRFGSRNPAPPVFIDTRRETHGRTPAERLRNVDVLEELCYYVPGENPSSEAEAYCCYSVCNCCGAPEYVQCGCPGREKCPQNPVKYSRRQRFTFEENEVKMNNFGNGPCWPFESARQCDPDPCTRNVTEKIGDKKQSRTTSATSCKNILPQKTGVYYFDSTRRMFIPQDELPKPPEIIYKRPFPHAKKQHHPAAPHNDVQEFEVFEEEKQGKNSEVVIQPVIQPVLMPNPCNPCNPCCNPCNQMNSFPNNANQNSNCFNQCNPCMPAMGCNPCNTCFNPFMSNPCNSILPMCIPMCAQNPPPPPPMFPMGGMFPPFFPQNMSKKKKTKKDKKGKKRSKKHKEEETILEFIDTDGDVPIKLSAFPAMSPPQVLPPSLDPPSMKTTEGKSPGSQDGSNHSADANANYSTNIIVAGGPAELAGNLGPPPPGAHSETLESQMDFVPNSEGGATTMISGDPNMVDMNLQPAAEVEESNTKVVVKAI